MQPGPGLINDEEDIALYGQFERGNYYKRLWPAELRRWNHCVEGIREVADMAADMGITLALQNHAPVLAKGYEDTLTMMQEIDRRNVQLCIDAPLILRKTVVTNISGKPWKNAKDILCTRIMAPGISARKKMAKLFRIPLHPPVT